MTAAFAATVVTLPLATAAIAAVYLRQYRVGPRARRAAVGVHFLSVTAIIGTYSLLCLTEYRTTAWMVVGWAVFAAGSVVFWYAVRSHPTCLVPDDQQGVVSAGPYSRIRHPIYSGGLLGALGLLGVAPSWRVAVAWLVLAACMGVLLAIEERELLARFGARYAQYRRDTDLLIPGVL
ncbi:MAG TPA: isoprenylcysteine carboxylmethyltransferase family protein [Solirubrobacteraceae bacterium]|nr:isoprenylcysteine carboxylmethyltransferase family protein [Solirubrobacteraceae bacterium]